MSQPIVIVPGTPYHLISRFVGGEWFIRTDHERRCYLQLLGDALVASDWRCFAFAVMSNHIHLGIVAGVQPLATWLREVHRPFAEWINERHERIGAVFVRGPKKLAVRSDGVATVISYIHQNPVRAGVVAHASASDWTSHAAYVGHEKPPVWLDTKLGLELGGWSTAAALDRWVAENAVQRKQVRAALLAPPAPRGRPRIDVGNASLTKRTPTEETTRFGWLRSPRTPGIGQMSGASQAA